MKKLIVPVVMMVAMSCVTNISQACTDIRITAKDGSVIIARTMEFAIDFKSNLRNSSRGADFKTTTQNGKSGLSWKAKYGYLYVDGMDIACAIDGMNEKGLSFEYLYLPGETKYPTVPEKMENKSISYLHFGDWILGNFASVEEVRQALPDIIVFAEKTAGLGDMIFPLHASIYDSTGKGIVIEFIEGKMNIHDNEIGVLTNAPTYPWHITNLRNYLNLSPYNPNPVIADGITFIATGQGSGMIGTPGDISPPSRFVKSALLLKTATTVADAEGAVNLAQHIINNVDIPQGLVRSKQKDGTDLLETTQWAVFKDLTHRVMYYRTYNDMTLRGVALDKVDFSKNAPSLKMPLSTKPFVQDVTDTFVKAK